MDAADRSSLLRHVPPNSSGKRVELPRSADGLPPVEGAFWSTLDSGLAAFEFELVGAARAAIDAHVRLLTAWNAHINLTALRDPASIARGHVLDSLIAVTVLRRLTRGRVPDVLDLGSGPGYPGLPLSVALPARRAALVDSVGKKAAFLEVAAASAAQAMRGAGADPPAIQVIAERAEDLAAEPDHRDAWDLVVARAVGSVAEVAELGLPLARPGGHVVVWKLDAGNGALRRELHHAARIVQAAGGATARLVPLDGAAQVGLAGHCLVVVTKHNPTPDRYPRPAGERQRRALT